MEVSIPQTFSQAVLSGLHLTGDSSSKPIALHEPGNEKGLAGG